jgi:hypothetical protein
VSTGFAFILLLQVISRLLKGRLPVIYGSADVRHEALLNVQSSASDNESWSGLKTPMPSSKWSSADVEGGCPTSRDSDPRRKTFGVIVPLWQGDRLSFRIHP